MKIKIYAIGHLKETYLKQGINEYIERIKPYSQIEIVEVNDEPLPNNPNSGDIEIAKNKEGQKVIKLLKDNEYLIGLDLVKKQPTSEEFAKYLEDKFVLGGANVSFVIGGSYSCCLPPALPVPRSWTATVWSAVIRRSRRMKQRK